MANTVGEVMTVNPRTVRANEPLANAAKVMRDADVGAVVVVEGTTVRGVLTDRDIAVRVVAEDLDPRTTQTSQVVSHDLVAVSPGDDLGAAVELMRTHAVRRLPVMEGEQLVGVLALGDLAVERDSDSALAQISTEDPNN